jgi:SAM-dependent methyltransferase
MSGLEGSTGSGGMDSPLRRAWERHAASWVAWARSPDHDTYWRFHRDLFLELVPPPGHRTLDLGCGEGRVARDLKRLGHSVVCLDGSAAMIEAARERDPAVEAVVADAAAMPFPDQSFDLAVAFMSLHDLDDVEGAVAEASRVLVPGGRLCIAVVHPINSAGGFQTEAADSRFLIAGSYLDSHRYTDHVDRNGLAMTFESAHHPIQRYTEALAQSGFVIERLREPAVPTAAVTSERARRWQRLPLFLHIRAAKLPGFS